MSFLAPLYILGAVGLGLPVLLHLIRRMPQGRQPFSSLMFLAPSPPRLSRRSRLDHLLLLILRCTALALLVLAFARPFLRQAAALVFPSRGGQYVAVLLDTSASMRREGLWDAAVARAQRVLDDAGAEDRVALLTFDSSVQTLVGFEDQPGLSARQRIELLRQRLSEIAPGWSHTNLGGALATAADLLDAAADEAGGDEAPGLQVVLVSDLQRGSELADLQSFQWPPGVRLQVEAVRPADPTNAGLQVLAAEDEADRVSFRVTNDARSTVEQFRLEPVSGKPLDGEAPSGSERPVGRAGASRVYVPPGESRVVHLPAAGDARPAAYRLVGDAHGFDNTAYVAPPGRQQFRVAYIGRDAADDPQGLRYYLQRAFAGTGTREYQFLALDPDEVLSDWEPLALVAVSDPPEGPALERLGRYLGGGGTVLLVVRSRAAEPLLRRWLETDDLAIEDPPPRDYSLLTEIAWDHRLFVPFASPQYGDFTKIRFWKHRRLTAAGELPLEILARFDNGDVALGERRVGQGSLLVLTSGWNPADSQLGLSTKFIPLLSQMLPGRGDRPPISHTVGQVVALPEELLQGEPAAVHRPDGTVQQLAWGEAAYRQTDQPGLYRAASGGQRYEFAVNVAAAESRTEPLDVEELESLGVVLAGAAAGPAGDLRQRQMLDLQLERRQQLWRWLILAAILVLVAETWLAGQRGRPTATAGVME